MPFFVSVLAGDMQVRAIPPVVTGTNELNINYATLCRADVYRGFCGLLLPGLRAFGV